MCLNWPKARDPGRKALVKVQAASVNAADWRRLQADPFLARRDVLGRLKPRNKILGFDVARPVEAAGCTARQVQPRDQVFGNIVDLRGGALAEYGAVAERLLVRKPANVTFEQAAAVTASRVGRRPILAL